MMARAMVKSLDLPGYLKIQLLALFVERRIKNTIDAYRAVKS